MTLPNVQRFANLLKRGEPETAWQRLSRAAASLHPLSETASDSVLARLGAESGIPFLPTDARTYIEQFVADLPPNLKEKFLLLKPIFKNDWAVLVELTGRAMLQSSRPPQGDAA
jgi:hypothetical protein